MIIKLFDKKIIATKYFGWNMIIKLFDKKIIATKYFGWNIFFGPTKC
jgi:hypothetical protein